MKRIYVSVYNFACDVFDCGYGYIVVLIVIRNNLFR